MKRRHARKVRSPARIAAFKRARTRHVVENILAMLAEAIPFAGYLPVDLTDPLKRRLMDAHIEGAGFDLAPDQQAAATKLAASYRKRVSA